MMLFQNYTFTLRTVSPLRVGNGMKEDAKQYYQDDINQRILRIDQRKWAKLLDENGLIGEYTDAILKGTNLSDFAKDNKLDISSAVLYALPVYRLPVKCRLHNDPLLHLFQKDRNEQPYIAGSSLKGMIINSLFAVYYEDIFPADRRKEFKDTMQGIMQKVSRAEMQRAFKRLLSDKVNKLMRAIRVSDSDPIDRSRLAACEKADVYWMEYPDSPVSEKNPGIFHESLIPDTEVTFHVSIDCGELKCFCKDMTAEMCMEWIQTALNQFRDMQDEYYTNLMFCDDAQQEAVIGRIEEENYLYFGAGTGWVNKTLLYPVFGNGDDSIQYVADLLDYQFKSRKHELDASMRHVSPHKLKCVYYQGQRYLMGVCAFSIQEVQDT